MVDFPILQGVCDDMKIAKGRFRPLPITLPAARAAADAMTIGGAPALADPDDGARAATLLVTEKCAVDRSHD